MKNIVKNNLSSSKKNEKYIFQNAHNNNLNCCKVNKAEF